jgi:hypothetical protein
MKIQSADCWLIPSTANVSVCIENESVMTKKAASAKSQLWQRLSTYQSMSAQHQPSAANQWRNGVMSFSGVAMAS